MSQTWFWTFCWPKQGDPTSCYSNPQLCLLIRITTGRQEGFWKITLNLEKLNSLEWGHALILLTCNYDPVIQLVWTLSNNISNVPKSENILITHEKQISLAMSTEKTSPLSSSKICRIGYGDSAPNTIPTINTVTGVWWIFQVGRSI